MALDFSYILMKYQNIRFMYWYLKQNDTENEMFWKFLKKMMSSH